MGQWVISRSRNHASVVYVNMVTGQRHNCGEVSAAMTDDELLAWILEEGRPAYGDCIKLSTGATFHYQPRPSLPN